MEVRVENLTTHLYPRSSPASIYSFVFLRGRIFTVLSKDDLVEGDSAVDLAEPKRIGVAIDHSLDRTTRRRRQHGSRRRLSDQGRVAHSRRRRIDSITNSFHPANHSLSPVLRGESDRLSLSRYEFIRDCFIKSKVNGDEFEDRAIEKLSLLTRIASKIYY